MAKQYGVNRIYSSVDEKTSALKTMCPQCKVYIVPKGISSTRPTAAGAKHCPNCGHTFGRDTLLGNRKVQGIVVSGAGGATTISVDNATLQMSATIAPFYAKNKAVTWSVTNGTGNATVSATGLLTPVGAGNGTVTVKATAQDGSGIIGQLIITLSNQV